MPNEVRLAHHAIITAGGTAEPIDNIRTITNSSSGRLGASIANSLTAAGVRTTVIGSKAMLSHPYWLDSRVKTIEFTTFSDLDTTLGEVIREDPPSILFMAAAIADYSPTPTTGKISSNMDKITVHMRRNPKLLVKLRDQCGPSTFIVGFKLLSGVSPDVLTATALAQTEQHRLDASVANDLAELRGPSHPLWYVTARSARRIEGVRDQVADELVGLSLQGAGIMATHSPAPTTGLWTDPGSTLASQWTEILAHLTVHARQRGFAKPYRPEPTFYRGELVGAVVHIQGLVTPFIHPARRGQGAGTWLLNQITARSLDLIVARQDAPWFEARGCTITDESHGLMRMTP